MTRIQPILIGLFLLAPVATAWSHALTVDCLFEDGTIYVESWEGTNEPTKGGKLTVLDSQDRVVHTAVLDDEGCYEYRPQKAERLTFTVDAGRGHKAKTTLNLTGQSLEPERDLVQPEASPPEMEGRDTPPPGPVRESKRPSLRSSQGGLTTGERIIMGLICIASLAAAYLGYRNQQRIAVIEETLRARDIDTG